MPMVQLNIINSLIRYLYHYCGDRIIILNEKKLQCIKLKWNDVIDPDGTALLETICVKHDALARQLSCCVMFTTKRTDAWNKYRFMTPFWLVSSWAPRL